MQTERDAEIVGWIGHLGAAASEHVMRRFKMGGNMTCERLSTFRKEGLLEHHAMDITWAGMYSVTSAGLRAHGLDRLWAWTVRLDGLEHAWWVAQAAVELHRGLDWDVLSQREVRSIEADRGELSSRCRSGRPAGRPMLHCPDLVWRLWARVSCRVEMSMRSASWLAAICRGWAKVEHISCVYYLAATGPGREVRRAMTGRC